MKRAHLFSQRAHVANTIGYRRRKGVAAIVERVAQDVTGWKVRLVEYFGLLSSTQHLHNVRLAQGRSIDLRQRAAVSQMGTPFAVAASGIDVRRISSGRGRHNVGNVGLFLWRLQDYPVVRGMAQAQADPRMAILLYHSPAWLRYAALQSAPAQNRSEPSAPKRAIPRTYSRDRRFITSWKRCGRLWSMAAQRRLTTLGDNLFSRFLSTTNWFPLKKSRFVI